MFCKSKYLQQCSQKSVLCHCHNVDSQPWEFPGWNLKLGLYTEGKKEADYPRLVGGSFNKHGNLHTRLALGGHKTSWLLHPPAWIIKVYIETLIKFNHIYYPDGLNNTLLSEDCGFEATPTVGTVGRMYIASAEEGVRSHWLPGPACSPLCRSTSGHQLAVTSSNTQSLPSKNKNKGRASAPFVTVVNFSQLSHNMLNTSYQSMLLKESMESWRDIKSTR